MPAASPNNTSRNTPTTCRTISPLPGYRLGRAGGEPQGDRPGPAVNHTLARALALALAALVLAPGSAPAATAADDGGGGRFDFGLDIAPLLAREGCAAAECHGGAKGRGGFKLSLFATDPRADYEALTGELGGRRIDLARPGRSLLLRKPTKQLKHGGGRVFSVGSDPYQRLVAWIREGAPYRRGDPDPPVRLDLVARSGGFSARVESASGLRRDVTQLTVFSSTAPLVAEIGEDGSVTPGGAGQAWIIARYAGLDARAPVVRRFAPAVVAPGGAGVTFEEEPGHPLDRAWLARLAELGLDPAPPAPAHQLARRLYLDLAGRPPNPHELEIFLRLPPDRRAGATADRLLASADFPRAFGRHLWDWFEVPRPGADPRGSGGRNAALRSFLIDGLTGGETLAETARRILLDPAGAGFIKRFEDPRDRAEFVGRSLLGISLGCARCHNHPHDRWRQSDHLRFSAFFAEPRPAAGGGPMMAGVFFLPGEGSPVEPRLLPLGVVEGADAGAATAPSDHSATVAAFILQRARSAFARNLANRIFAALAGRALVEPPDDHRPSNPALHEPVLEALSAELLRSGTDLRAAVRLVVTSRFYAASSDPPDSSRPSADPARHFLARREARPLPPDIFDRSVDYVLGGDPWAAGPAAEGPAAPSPLARQLRILNSGQIQERLRRPGNAVEALFDFTPGAGAQLDGLYRLILSRPPRPAEREAFLPLLEGADGTFRAGRDLATAFLAGREFGSLR